MSKNQNAIEGNALSLEETIAEGNCAGAAGDWIYCF